MPEMFRFFPARVRFLALGLALLAWAPQTAGAETFYVAPPGDDTDEGTGGDGSTERPFASVAAALDSGQVKGGDTVLLLPGQHGEMILANRNYAPPLVLASAPGGRAHLEWLRIRKSSGLVLRGFNIWPEQPARVVKPAVVHVRPSSREIVMEDLDIRSWPGAEDYYQWSADAWLTQRNKGVQLDGTDTVLRSSQITGVTTGVGIQGSNVTVADNDIRGFSKDGMRILGIKAQVVGNTIRDCVKVDKNHDDGIQSWAGRGRAPAVVRDVLVDGNQIIQWTGPADHPLRCTLQGIGLFNGPFENWRIQNNLILVSAWHGIHLSQGRHNQILNNTVVHPDGVVGKKPWIQIRPLDHSRGNVVANNISQALRLGKEEWPWPNAQIRHPHATFRDASRLDFRLSPDSPLIDSAMSDGAPDHDLTGAPRPQGKGHDFGAFEGG